MIDFKKYELYENNRYKKLLKETYDLNKNKNIYTYTLRDKDRKIIDKVELTQKEVDEGKNNNLSNYTKLVGSNKETKELISNKEKEIQEFREKFYKNIKSIFVQDFASYKNISIAKAYVLLKYTITSLNLFHAEVKDALSYEDIEYYATCSTYEETMEASYNISSSGFKTLYNHMSNNLNLLSIR